MAFGFGRRQCGQMNPASAPARAAARVARVQQRLADYGYGIEANGVLDQTTEKVLKAFQSHFRQRRVDGRLDRSTELTLDRLIEAAHRRVAA